MCEAKSGPASHVSRDGKPQQRQLVLAGSHGLRHGFPRRADTPLLRCLTYVIDWQENRLGSVFRDNYVWLVYHVM